MLFVTNRKKCREGFIPIVLHHNVRVNTCISARTGIVFRFFTVKNIKANNSLALCCIFSLSQMTLKIRKKILNVYIKKKLKAVLKLLSCMMV